MTNHGNSKPRSFPEKIITFKLSSKGKQTLLKECSSPKKHGKQSFGDKKTFRTLF